MIPFKNCRTAPFGAVLSRCVMLKTIQNNSIKYGQKADFLEHIQENSNFLCKKDFLVL